MKYIVETNRDGYTETLEVDGRKYTKKWIQSELGMKTTDDGFAEQLEADEADSELVEKVYENIDDSFFGHDFYKMI